MYEPWTVLWVKGNQEESLPPNEIAWVRLVKELAIYLITTDGISRRLSLRIKMSGLMVSNAFQQSINKHLAYWLVSTNMIHDADEKQIDQHTIALVGQALEFMNQIYDHKQSKKQQQ